MDPTPLQTLLELRRREEDAARVAWNAARAHLEVTEGEATRREAAVAQARARFADARQRQVDRAKSASAPVSAASIGTDARFLTRLRSVADRAAEASGTFRAGPLADALAREREAAATHDDKRRAREAVERHEARRAAELEREAERRAEDTRDDVASAVRHARTGKPRS